MPELVNSKELKIRYKGHPVLLKSYKCKWGRENIKKFCQSISDALSKGKAHGDMIINLYYDGIGWRSGKITSFGAQVNLFNFADFYDDEQYDYEPKFFTRFDVFLLKKPSNEGGTDNKYNDCLFFALKRACNNNFPWNYPWTFKKYLSLGRSDLVPIDRLAKIEHALDNYKINVAGDYIYQSTKDAKFEINLILKNNHYSLNTSHIQNLHGVAHEEKKILFYRYLDDGTKETYDGFEIKILNKQEFEAIYKNPYTSEYLPVISHKEDMTQEYHKFIKDIDELKSETNGLINCYKTGGYVQTALKLFYHYTQSINPEIILDDEVKFLKNASCGAVMYAEPYKGPGYKYDFVSRYPSSLASQHNYYPIKRGEFLKISPDEFISTLRRPGTCIFRCQIERKQNKICNIFRFNINNYYTSKDVVLAQKLGLKISMIDDNEPNVLYYSHDKCVCGSQLFGNFVKTVFELKKKGNKTAKAILNCLWGALCQTQELDYNVADDGEEYDLGFDKNITSIIYDDKKHRCIVKYTKQNKYFVNRYARIKSFILAYGRHCIITELMDNIDNIVYIHTDGWISKTEMNVKIGTELNCVKFEGYDAECEVKNVINYKFLEHKLRL